MGSEMCIRDRLLLIALGFLVALWVTRPRTPEGRAEADSLWLPGREPAAEVEADSPEGAEAGHTDGDGAVETPRTTTSSE